MTGRRGGARRAVRPPPDPDPLQVKTCPGEVVCENTRRTFVPAQRREHIDRFRPEPEGAPSGLGICKARDRPVPGQLPDLLPTQMEHFGI